VADGVREIDQSTLVGPKLVVLGVDYAEGEVGRLPGLDRRYELVRKLRFGMEDEFDLLARLLLEGRDDLPDRLVLLRVVAFVPPHDEIGGASVERRENERRSKNDGSAMHDAASPDQMTARACSRSAGAAMVR
jgi:hypothetical protein